MDRTDTDDPRGLIDCMTASIALRTDSRADPGDHEWDVEPLVARRVPRKGAALWHGQRASPTGATSALLGLLGWLYLGAQILLAGAALNQAIELWHARAAADA